VGTVSIASKSTAPARFRSRFAGYAYSVPAIFVSWFYGLCVVLPFYRYEDAHGTFNGRNSSFDQIANIPYGQTNRGLDWFPGATFTAEVMAYIWPFFLVCGLAPLLAGLLRGRFDRRQRAFAALAGVSLGAMLLLGVSPPARHLWTFLND
jgi:hypothetical protein